ncbi:MAG: bleomycin resistance protein [Corynebacterium sp.]|nr:bleomycin resistance protein [Corynebacterium sp.]
MTSVPIPSGHNTINPFVAVPNGKAFIDFVIQVFDGKELEQVRTPDRDGSLIHTEVMIGNSTIMLFDRKPDWHPTPALLQVYVSDIATIINRATAQGATVVTPTSPFYGGYDLAQILDPWHNLWWLYSPAVEKPADQADRTSSTDWHSEEPSLVYTTWMDTMRALGAPHSNQ